MGASLCSPRYITMSKQFFSLPDIPLELQHLFCLLSHGLRKPITNIRWASNVLRTKQCGSLSVRQQQLVEVIYSQSHLLADIVDSVMLLLNIQNDKSAIKCNEVNIQSLIVSAEKHVMKNSVSPCKITISDEADIIAATDADVLEAVFKIILLALINTLPIQNQTVQIQIIERDNSVFVEFASALKLSCLSKKPSEEIEEHSCRIAGDTGLLFSLAKELLNCTKAKLHLEKGKEGVCNVIVELP